MKALVEKEIRMLLPAFGGALVLAVLPVFLLPRQTNWGDYNEWLYMFGIMMLGVSAFGREMGLKTIPFILAQPLERSRIWRTKISVLGCCTALVFCAWRISMFYNGHDSMRNSLENLEWMALVVVVLITGGIWMTLLVRQMAATFWLAYLVPVVIGVAIKAMGGADWIVVVALCLYSASAFFLARWQFLHLQDSAWTGRALTLGSSRSIEADSQARDRAPWRTLFRKELKLHTFTLAGIAALFVVHLGVIAVRKSGAQAFSQTTLFALQSFGLVWIVVPFVAGSQSVAEERQNGTLDGLLCLPVSRRAQFAVKLAFVLVLGGLLSAALLCSAEAIGDAMGAGTGGVVGNAFEFGYVVIGFLVLSLVGFYASTLTRSVAQALAAGVVVVGAYSIIRNLAAQLSDWDLFGKRLWPVVANPALVLALLWLSYGNFKWTFETGRRWRRNFIALATVVVLTSVCAVVVYHRAWGVWEWTEPMERAHGPAIIPPGKHVTLSSSGWNGIAAVLPDGRLWRDRVVDDANVTVSGGNFAPGSNWVDVVLLANETVAIRSNGTLWVSDKPGATNGLIQFGAESDWQSVARYTFYSVALLKRDGTLWTWGPIESSPTHYVGHGQGVSWGLGTNIYKGEYPGLRSFFTPARFHPESDWARIVEGGFFVYAWKKDGEAWAFHRPEREDNSSAVRLPNLDRFQFKSYGSSVLWVRDDGTLWWHRSGPLDGGTTPLVQIGKDSDWVAATGWAQLMALKADGSIWRLNMQSIDALVSRPPHRIGRHSDWVGLGNWNGRSAALAADGSIWLWPRENQDPINSDEWLAPRNRPTEIENIFKAHMGD